MKIKCYKDNLFGHYSIIIGKSLYEMSDNANQPNGVNIYAGEVNELDIEFNELDEIMIGNLPNGVLIAIIRNMQLDFNNIKAQLESLVNEIIVD